MLIVLLSIVCVLLAVNGTAYYICLTLNSRHLQKSLDTFEVYKESKEVFDLIQKNIEKVKRVQNNHTRLILKSFVILRDSIEKDLTNEQILKIINDLNLPLDDSNPVKEIQNDRP